MNRKIVSIEDLYKYIEITPDNCWIWLLGKADRLPSYKVGGTKKRRPAEHFWKQKYGNFPAHDIWKKCSSNRCVNPDHYIEYSSDVKRFMLKVDKESSECWEWSGSKNRFGYGMFRIKRDVVAAHRFSYHHFVDNTFPVRERNEQDEKIHILHTCDNPSCVRPEHLFVGSDYDNCLDRDMKGRHGTAKLNSDDVKEIRQLFQSGGYVKDISKLFNLTESNCYAVINNKHWKWVKEENESRYDL